MGADGRLPSELESGLFRIVDDAVQGFLDARPEEFVVVLDWQEHAVKATVRGRPSGHRCAPADVARAAVAAARRDKQMPAALASMIHELVTANEAVQVLKHLGNLRRGQGLAEYALILALIAVPAIAAVTFLGGQIDAILSDVGGKT